MKKMLLILLSAMILDLNCNAQTAEPLEKPQLAQQASDANEKTQDPVDAPVKTEKPRSAKASDSQKTEPRYVKKINQSKDSFFKPANILTIIFGSLALAVSVGSLLLSNKSNKAQNRAYVHASSATFENDALGARVILEATNTGQTPAKWWETASISGIYEPGETNLTDEIDFEKIKEFSRWPALVNGQPLTAGIGKLSDQELIKQALQTRKLCFFVYGVIRYKTMFNEVFETQFVFYHPEPRAEMELSRPNMHIECYKHTNGFV